jgi:hypothetical protein
MLSVSVARMKACVAVLQVALGHFSDTSCAQACMEAHPTGPPREACAWESHKSRRITWDDVAAADPDVLVVACCGFDFLRNCADAQAALTQNVRARSLRAVQEGSVFAVDGNRCASAH